MLKQIKYLSEALLACIYFLVCYLLPLEVASSLSGKLLEIIGCLFKANKVAYKNLTLCFPNLSEQEKHKIIKKMWNNLGRVIGEIPHWQTMSSKKFTEQVTICDYSNGGFQKVKSALFLSAHYGNWEIFPRFLKENNLNLSLVYRPANNPFVDYIISRARDKHGIIQIKKGVGGIRKIMESLKSGHLIGMLVDQKTNDGIEVPFFNLPTRTTSAPANLALKFNIPIHLACVTRIRGAQYKIEIFPAIIASTEENTHSITSRINLKMEQWIRKDPTQWFWVHKRWDKKLYYD